MYILYLILYTITGSVISDILLYTFNVTNPMFNTFISGSILGIIYFVILIYYSIEPFMTEFKIAFNMENE